MSSAIENHLPPALESMRAYLDRARELHAAKPVASHYLRVFAMNIAMSLRSRLKPPDIAFVSAFMDELEQERSNLEAKRVAGMDNPHAAIQSFALDLYNRARSADKPEVNHPHPSQKWTVVDAPKVAQAFHASAVLLDCLRQFTPLTKDTADVQKLAHSRSQQLSGQLARALNCPPCVPVEWCPLPEALLTPPASSIPTATNPAARPRPLPSLPSVPNGGASVHTPLDGGRSSVFGNVGPAGLGAGAGTAPQAPVAPAAFAKGDEAWYFERSSGWHPTVIAAVHSHGGAPYYTILHPLALGKERETELDRLRPRQPRQLPPAIPAPDPLHPAEASARQRPLLHPTPPPALPPFAPQAAPPAAPPTTSPCACDGMGSAGYCPGPGQAGSLHWQPSASLSNNIAVPALIPPPAFVPRSTASAQNADGSASLLSRLRVGDRPMGEGAPAAPPPQNTVGGPTCEAFRWQYYPQPPLQHYAPQQPTHEAAAGAHQVGEPAPTWPSHYPSGGAPDTLAGAMPNVTSGCRYSAPPATAGHHRTSPSSSAESLMKSLLQ